jgi:hypothetical protein
LFLFSFLIFRCSFWFLAHRNCFLCHESCIWIVIKLFLIKVQVPFTYINVCTVIPGLEYFHYHTFQCDKKSRVTR